MAFSQKKRFVAGALCPRCGGMDKILVYREADQDFRECVQCGFKEEMLFKPVARELETRVNVSVEEKQSQVQIIKILPPK